MQLKYLCYTIFMMTLAATCIQARSKTKIKEERLVGKRNSRQIATLVLDDTTSGSRMFSQPKIIYRKLSKKSYAPPSPTYGPRRTKYGPPRTLKKPAKKYRGKKGSKHPFPYPYKKRAPNTRYGSRNRATMKPVYGAPKHNHRLHGVGFGEPPLGYPVNKYSPPKSSKFTRNQKPQSHTRTPKPHHDDFSSSATIGDNFSNKPHHDELWSQEQFVSASSLGFGETPVDSYGAPVKANLHDLTFSTAPAYLESTSHLDEDLNFGPESRPWQNLKAEPDNILAYSVKRPIYRGLEKEAEVYVTPVPQQQNQEPNSDSYLQELKLNSYSDIYNHGEEEKAKPKKKRKLYFQKNVKMINHPWFGSKTKEEPKEDVIVGGQYAEPPARYVPKFDSEPILGDESRFSAFINNDDNDMAVPISSYVNYKNSNMAFSPQNLNDVFSIVDK